MNDWLLNGDDVGTWILIKPTWAALVTAVAGSGEIGEGAGEARAVFHLDGVGKRHQWLLDHVNLLDGNILIETRGIDEAIFDLAQSVACEFPYSPSKPAYESLKMTQLRRAHDVAQAGHVSVCPPRAAGMRRALCPAQTRATSPPQPRKQSSRYVSYLPSPA